MLLQKRSPPTLFFITKIEVAMQSKIDHSIALIRKAEKLALAMQPEEGFHVSFSGGKDSQVVLELVKMAGVKYKAVYSVTTNDPADNVRFIKQYYHDVEFRIPGESYFQLIEKKGVPTMYHRWCCALFKETTGVGCVVLAGVRKEESRKRAEYPEAFRFSRKKGEKEVLDLDKMEANEFRCIGGKDKFMVYPILEWTEEDVWNFIAMRGLPVNPCYKTHKRVGCVFCPFARPKDIRAYCETHPKLKSAFIRAIQRYREKNDSRQILPTAEADFDWWLSRMNIDEYVAKQRQLKLVWE